MRSIFTVCKLLSYSCSVFHYFLIKLHIFDFSVFLRYTVKRKFKTLNSVWYAKNLRRLISFLIRTPFKRLVLDLINFNSIFNEQGCIFVTCRTPQKRLLVQWCLKTKFRIVITHITYNDERRSIHRQGRGFTELRSLVKYLQQGGRIIALVDVFNNLNNCPITFMGRHHNISVFAERFASLAGVPILVNIPRLTDKGFDFISRPQFLNFGKQPKDTIVTMQILSFIEQEIIKNLSIWSKFVNK